MGLLARIVVGGACILFGALVIDDLIADTGWRGPSGKNTWPAIYGLSLISVGIGFLILP